MKPEQKWTYIIFVGCILLSLVFLMYSYNAFHIMRMTVMGILVSIPIVFGSDAFKNYTRLILIGVLIYMISAHVTTRSGGGAHYRMVISCVIYIIYTRAFMTFKGFTFKTLILLVLGFLALGFFVFLGGELKSDLYLTIVFVILFVNMVWQGINLFAIHTSRGNFFILVYALLYIVINLLGGLNLYLVKSYLLEVCSQVLHWFALLALVHTTTLDRREFNELL